MRLSNLKPGQGFTFDLPTRGDTLARFLDPTINPCDDEGESFGVDLCAGMIDGVDVPGRRARDIYVVVACPIATAIINAPAVGVPNPRTAIAFRPYDAESGVIDYGVPFVTFADPADVVVTRVPEIHLHDGAIEWGRYRAAPVNAF